MSGESAPCSAVWGRVMRKPIGRRPVVNRTGNKSTGRVRAQDVLTRTASVIRVSTLERVTLPALTAPEATHQLALGIYLKTNSRHGATVDVDLEIREALGGWSQHRSERWTVGSDWAIYGFFLSEDDRTFTQVRLRIAVACKRSTSVQLWGYVIGPFSDLTPKVEREIRTIDPAVNEAVLATILKRLRANRFKYIESGYLNHASWSLLRSERADPLDEAIPCKHCSLCERLLPLGSFHRHKRFRSQRQLECKACKNCNINPKLNYKRTKQQLLEASLIRRELEALALEGDLLGKNPRFLDLLFERFEWRCFNCGRNVNRQTGHVDHTRPLVALWPLDEHATLLCRDCNIEKAAKFPVEFYRSTEKLRALANLTGLPFDDLTAKRMKPEGLARVMANVSEWYQGLRRAAATRQDLRRATGIPDRSFRAVARRAEKLEGVNLYELYREQTGEEFPGRR